MNIHLIKGVAVLVFLAVAWLVATYFIAKRAKGRRERSFTMRAGFAVLLGILLFSALDYFALKSHGGLAGVLILFTVAGLRRKQLAIRREEANA